MHYYLNLHRGLLPLIFFGLFFPSLVLSQDNESANHKIWVKFKESLPESHRYLGDIKTGKPSLDRLSNEFSVIGIHRVFPPSFNFEQAHQSYGLHQWYEVEFADTLSTPAKTLAELFCKNTLVNVAEAIPVQTHFILDRSETEVAEANDPRYEDQWHYNNTGQSEGTPGADIGLNSAWALASGAENITVAVIDGGIDVQHEDLQDAVWINKAEQQGEKGVDDDGNGYVDDIYGYDFSAEKGKIYADRHGTHVAGTIGAVTNNGIGVAGVAGGDGKQSGVRLMNCVVFSRSGQGGFPQAFVYAADNGAIIAQNSWGGGGTSQLLEDAIRYFRDRAGLDNSDENFDRNIQIGPMAGGLVVFAAGNNKTSRPRSAYPASLETVMAVTSLDHNDLKSDFANYGDWVDIAAPGSEVLSTLPGNSYGYLSGTSMACPHVSGVAALAISRFQRQGFTNRHLSRLLLTHTDDIDQSNSSYQGELGAGRVNAYRVLSTDTELPPAAITDLSVSETTFNSVTLSCTATGADERKGMAAYYEVYLSKALFEVSGIEQATRTLDKLPASSGETEMLAVKDLLHTTRYYVSIRAVDLLGNRSPWSEVVQATTNEPPRIRVRPDEELVATVEAGELATDTIIIDNSLGKSPLTFHLATDHSTATEEWFYAEIDSGVVSAGGQKAIICSWDARSFNASYFKSELQISSNDPSNSLIVLPLNLTVTGSPKLSLSPGYLNFKEMYRTFSKEKNLQIRNRGTDTLKIEEIESSNAAFAAEEVNIAIAPDEEYMFRVAFSPEFLGVQTGELTIFSNDPINPEHTVVVEGMGLEPPPLLISPEEVITDVVQDSISIRNIRLQNTLFTDTIDWRTDGTFPNWLIPLDSAGTLLPREAKNFKFKLTAEGKEIGAYSSRIEFRFAEQDSEVLPITMKVVEPNFPPVWKDSPVNLSVVLNGGETTFNLLNFVDDPEGDPLYFEFAWAGEPTAFARIDGNVIYIKPQRQGESEGTITAIDDAGNKVSVPFILVVLPENQPPQPVLETLALKMRLSDEPTIINLDSLFLDPNQDFLTYSFTRPLFSSVDLGILESSVAKLQIKDGLLIGLSNALGEQEVAVYAYDPYGEYSSITLQVSVLEPNQSPQIDQEIADQYFYESQEWKLNLLDIFSDPDGDSLTFQVEVEDAAVAQVEVDDGSLQVMPRAPGETEVRITALDYAGDQATLSFVLEVDQLTPISSTLPDDVVKIYPNPARDRVFVNHSQIQAIKVYNAQGKVFHPKIVRLADKSQLYISSLPTGVYSVMVLTQSGKTYRTSLIKE